MLLTHGRGTIRTTEEASFFFIWGLFFPSTKDEPQAPSGKRRDWRQRTQHGRGLARGAPCAPERDKALSAHSQPTRRPGGDCKLIGGDVLVSRASAGVARAVSVSYPLDMARALRCSLVLSLSACLASAQTTRYTTQLPAGSQRRR